jgi:hypothetical protein
MAVTPHDILVHAADLMRKRGLYKGEHGDSTGRMCMHSVLDDAAQDLGASGAVHALAEHQVLMLTGCEYIREWNDRPEITSDHAAYLFEWAAALAWAFYGAANHPELGVVARLPY